MSLSEALEEKKRWYTFRLFGTNSLKEGAMWGDAESRKSESERSSIATQRLSNQVSCIIVWVTIKHVYNQNAYFSGNEGVIS
jgi:hypothetical protein